MKLFENGVGRPSNEIKKQRKIFIASAIMLCVALISVFSYALTKVNTGRLQGASKKYSVKEVTLDFDTNNTWWNGPGSNYRYLNFHIKSNKAAIHQFAVVACKTEAECKKTSAWDEQKSKEASIPDTKNSYPKMKVYSEITSNKSLAGNVFYLRVTTYNTANPNSWLAREVYKVNVATTTRSCSVGKCYKPTKTLVWRETNPSYVKQETTTTTVVNKGPSSNGVEKEDVIIDYKPTELSGGSTTKKIKLKIGKVGSIVDSASIVICESEKECKKSNAYELIKKKNKKSVTNKKFKNNEIVTMELSTSSKTSANKAIFIKMTTYDKNKKALSTIIYKAVTSSKAKSGSKDTYNFGNKKLVATKYYTAVEESLSLTCPGTAKTQVQFQCSANKDGVEFIVPASKATENGLETSNESTKTSTFTIKFTDKLFELYPKQIKKDSNGQYISVVIYAEKDGKKVSRNVKVYKNTSGTGSVGMSSTSRPEQKIDLACPQSTKVGQSFKCATNVSGVKLSVPAANALEKGFNSSFVTTNKNMSISIRFNSKLFSLYPKQIKKDSKGEYISVAINAEKSGYSKITEYVKVYK